MGSICRIADTGVVVVGTVAGVQTKSSLEHSTVLVLARQRHSSGCDAAAAAWRPDAGRSPHHTAPTTATPAWSPGSGFSFHTPPFISLLGFYCTVSFGNLEVQMQNCTKWEVKQAIIKSLYCVNCDWYGNETLTEVYILYCLCLCHILYLTKVHSCSSWGAMLASL